MSALALVLILMSTVCHATWNLIVKRTGGGVAFVWLFDLVTVVVYMPLAVIATVGSGAAFGFVGLFFLLGSTLLHLAYFLLLQRGYRFGDLSLVYPIARGTGPILSTVGAIILFGERPTPLALVGAGCIVSGVFVLAGGAPVRRLAHYRSTVGYAVLTGLFIAAYTLWDSRAVRVALVPPVLVEWGSAVGRAGILATYAAYHRTEVTSVWRKHWRAAIGVGVLSPLAYILVLTAMTFTPVSYVAPARESSILIGVLMGNRLLAEGHTRVRIVAAAAIILGVAALALG